MKGIYLRFNKEANFFFFIYDGLSSAFCIYDDSERLNDEEEGWTKTIEKQNEIKINP